MFSACATEFWIVIIVHCHCYHCSLLLSSLLIVIIIIIHYYCSSLVSLCIVAFLILLLQEYGYCGHCALLLYILCIVIVVNCSLCTNLPQSIAHCYCSTLFIVHCYSFLLSIVIGHCSHCMDLMLYRTANLAPFPGEPQMVQHHLCIEHSLSSLLRHLSHIKQNKSFILHESNSKFM